MASERKTLTARDIGRTAWSTFKSTRKQTLALVFMGLILPQAALSLVFDIHSVGVARELRSIFTMKAGSTPSFAALVAPALPYASQLAAFIFLIFLLLFASYFALVHTAVDHLQGQPPRGAMRAWVAGLRSAVPGGMVVALALFFLMVIGQVLIAPAVLAAVLGMILPVILVVERRGAFPSLWHSLTLRWVRGTGHSGWSVMFSLMSLTALIYAALAGTGVLSETLLLLDERLGLPRDVWAATFPGMDFGPVYLAVNLLETVVTMLLTAAVPALTASLYFKVAVRRNLGQA